MLEVFRRIATGTTPPTSDQLQAALEQIDLGTYATAVADAETEYRESLLSGSESAVSKAEDRIAAARRDHSRALVARDELTLRLTQTKDAETRVALEAERTEADSLAQSVSADLKRDYAAASKKIVAVLERLIAAEEQVEAVNRKLEAAGLARLAGVEARALPVPPGLHAGTYAILRHTSLRPVPGAPGFGDAVEAWRISGLTE